MIAVSELDNDSDDNDDEDGRYDSWGYEFHYPRAAGAVAGDDDDDERRVFVSVANATTA